jgi:tight adherence protein B
MDLNSFVSPTIGLAVISALGVLILFVGLAMALSGRNSVIDARLDRYAGRKVADSSATNLKAGGRFDNLVNEKRGSAIGTELARADIRLTAGEYVAINLVTVFVGAILGVTLSGGNFVLALIGAVVGFYIPRIYVRWKQGRRLDAFNKQLGDTIVLLSNSLRSGYSLLQSMETASKELSAPMSVELTRVTREIGLGLSVQDALANMYRRMPSDDLDLLITAINVQHEVGGNLAEILDNIAHTIRERIRIMGEIKTITAQQRLSGIVLAALPILLGFVMYFLNPGYIARMWQSLCGLLMLFTGGIMIVIGYFVIRRITDIKV